LSSLVEVVASVAMIVIGVILQVNGSSGGSPNAVLTVTGGVLVAIGGVLLSWMASRILAERQREEAASTAKRDKEAAMEAAQAEVDEKLNNLSRILGQSAGQISQTVEKVEMGSISEVTGFELISQANRMIYGQVNEIAVMRKAKFDSAYLLETATTLDKLGRELTARTHGDDGQHDPAELESVREQIDDVLKGLLSGDHTAPRATSEVHTTCPYCDKPVQVSVGTTPGDTASATCSHCGEGFNIHRNSAGAGFTRKRGPRTADDAPAPPSRWMFKCPMCQKILGAPKNGKGERVMVCPGCFWSLHVDPGTEVVTKGCQLDKVDAAGTYRSGTRPKAPCPKCQTPINMPLRYSDGYFGFCVSDRIALLVADRVWDEMLLHDGRPAA
jgi:transcription elongation factor Elf1